MSFIMGVDGGGSKTYTVITKTNGDFVGEGISLGANYQKIGIEKTIIHIRESMDMALVGAGLSYDDLTFVQYTLAGADRELDVQVLRSALSHIPVKNWALECDTMAGLRSGAPDYVGVVLVCGSGTNAAGRSSNGKRIQTGGFGYLYGDGAGGNSMAIETFRSAIRSWEFREIPSILTEKIPRFFGFQTMEQVHEDFLNRQASSVPGELTIVLHEAVMEGDPLAINILRKTGKELGIAANSVIRRIEHFGVDMIPVVLTGSVFQKGRNSHLLQSLEQTVREQYVNTNFVIPKMEPVFGAILLGMDHMKIPINAEIFDKFNSMESELVNE